MPILRNMAFGYMAVFYEGHYLLPKLISNLMSVTAVPTIWLMSSFKRKKKIRPLPEKKVFSHYRS